MCVCVWVWVCGPVRFFRHNVSPLHLHINHSSFQFIEVLFVASVLAKLSSSRWRSPTYRRHPLPKCLLRTLASEELCILGRNPLASVPVGKGFYHKQPCMLLYGAHPGREGRRSNKVGSDTIGWVRPISLPSFCLELASDLSFLHRGPVSDFLLDDFFGSSLRSFHLVSTWVYCGQASLFPTDLYGSS